MTCTQHHVGHKASYVVCEVFWTFKNDAVFNENISPVYRKMHDVYISPRYHTIKIPSVTQVEIKWKYWEKHKWAFGKKHLHSIFTGNKS